MTATTESLTEQATLSVSGMDCASCVAHVEKAARSIGGVQACQVSLARGRAIVRFDPEKTSVAAVAAAISDSGYPAHQEQSDSATAESQRVAQQSAHAQ